LSILPGQIDFFRDFYKYFFSDVCLIATKYFVKKILKNKIWKKTTKEKVLSTLKIATPVLSCHHKKLQYYGEENYLDTSLQKFRHQNARNITLVLYLKNSNTKVPKKVKFCKVPEIRHLGARKKLMLEIKNN
jgi:hypothetical protein